MHNCHEVSVMRCLHTINYCYAVNCGPPAPPPNGYLNAYNSTQEASTREGAEVNVTCLSEPQQQHTMTCSAGGQWEPDFSGFCKNVSGIYHYTFRLSILLTTVIGKLTIAIEKWGGGLIYTYIMSRVS